MKKREMREMSNVVEIHWLYDHLHDPEVVVVDCRFALGQPVSGRTDYEEGHIAGAVYFDLDQDMSAPIEEHGGRHPLPDLQQLAAKLGRAGIDAQKFVVAYDEGGAMSSRFWWLLRYMGHERVAVLNGGFFAWKANGYETTAVIPQPVQTTFVPTVQADMRLSMEDVRSRLGTGKAVLIDSREHIRYIGKEEPIDPVAGHIPGARNAFWKDSLDEQGRFKPGKEQAERFSGIAEDQEIIVYCGSGVTACPNVLALMEAGFSQVRLYSGSWSDWISYSENPIATGEE